MATVSIIIPAFNEEHGIGPVVDALRAAVPDAELIVVDDGSSDRTAEVAQSRGARVVRRPINGGYGRSIKDGVGRASADTIVITDADGTYPAESIPALLTEYAKGFSMVVGARQGKVYRGSLFKGAMRFVLIMIVEFVTGRKIPDVNSGLRVFSKKEIEPFFPDICDGFSFTTTITLVYLLTHRSVFYVPIPYEKRTGISKVKLFRDMLRTLQYVTECIVRYNPLKLFFLLSSVILVVGAVSGIAFGWAALIQSFFFASTVFSLGLIAETLRRPRM